MARTRSTKATPSGEAETKPVKADAQITLAPQAENPSVLFILPKRATPEAQIVVLPHPRHSQPSRYLVCPETGLYEFTKTSAPKAAPRSWLLEKTAGSTSNDASTKSSVAKAQLVTKPELYIATAIDPLFLLLPALNEPQQGKQSDRKRMFLASDDYFDKLSEQSSHLSEILRHEKIRSLFETRMGVICDTVEAGDETMFRLNERKLASVLLGKAKKFSKQGLPPSMETKFVKKPLEAPIAVKQKAFIITETETTEGSDTTGASTPITETTDSQSTAASLDSAASASTALTSVTEVASEAEAITRVIEPTAEIIELQRIRVALDYVCAAYISPSMGAQIREDMASQASDLIDFAPLNDYLAKVATLRAEAFAERPVDFNHRKRGREEEEDEQLEKKRKLEEEKKKKAQESRSIKNLKKVDTSGMKKLSAFFKKK